MILPIPPIVIVDQQVSKPLRLSEAAVSIPIFKYPSLFRIALVQGSFTFRIQIESGSITQIKQTTEEPKKLGSGLATSLVSQIKAIQFAKNTSGTLDLVIQLKLVGERVWPEQSQNKIVIHSEINLIEIESNPLLAQICDAPAN